MCKLFVEAMQNEFEMSMLDKLSFFLGLQITRSNKGIFIYQTKYVKEMLKKFKMKYCKLVDTPMVTGCKLSKANESTLANQTKYRSMIGSLLSLIASRPEIMQALCMVAKFQVAPKETHVKAVTRIFRYLKYTMDYGL